MAAQDVHKLIADSFPDADIEIIDLAGDGDHYKAIIHSSAFQGKTRIAQHQMVFAALKDVIGGALHALALETKAK